MGYTADISMFPYFKNELKEENEENNLIDKNDLLEMIMDEGFDTDLYDEEDFDVEIFIHNVKEHIEEEKEKDEKENDELKEKNDELKELLKESAQMMMDREYQHTKKIDELITKEATSLNEIYCLKKEKETLKMKLVSLEEFKEKAFEENTASAVCETMMERIDTLEHKLEDYKQTITVHKDECLRNVRRANSYDEYIMTLVLGTKDDPTNYIENIDQNIMEKIDQNELNVLLEVLENNGIYYCVDDDEFANDEADIQCADMCNQYRQDMDEDDDESDIDIEGYCEWYCDNYGVRRCWLKEGFFWIK